MGDVDRARASEDHLALLLAEWVLVLLQAHLGVQQIRSSGPRAWSATVSTGEAVEFSVGDGGRLEVSSPQPSIDGLEQIALEAHRRAGAGDVGEGVWWRAAFSTDVALTVGSELHMIRVMSEHTPFDGQWRLGDEVLIDFKQGHTEPGPVFFPKFTTDIYFRVAAPGHGPYSRSLAEERGTILRAIVAFVVAAPVEKGAIFPLVGERMDAVKASIASAPELPFGDAPIWEQLEALVPETGPSEARTRVLGAMFSYEQAISQQSGFVALVLLVSALEALSVPNAPGWASNRVTSRFISFVRELCPDAIDETMRHDNFANAFGAFSSSTRFLNELYDLRSKPLHTGFVAHGVDFLMGDNNGKRRLILVSDLVRKAIASFLRRPFSSLIGNPAMAPDAPT